MFVVFVSFLISSQFLLAATISNELNAQFLNADLSAESIVYFSQAIEGHSISDAELLQYGQIFIAAQGDDLPLSLLSERLAQGLLKGVPADRLQNALLVFKENLLWWKATMEKHVAKAELRKNVEARQESYRMMDAFLRSGFEKTEIEQILGQQQVTLMQVSAAIELAMEMASAGAAKQSVIQLCRKSLSAGLTAEELGRISQKLELSMLKETQLDAEFFSQFESSVAAEFDFSSGISTGLLDDISEMADDVSIDAIQDLNETILSNDMSTNIDVELNDSLEDIKSVMDDVELNQDQIDFAPGF